MADLPSILGGMAQGFLDFGKSAVDLFGTGGASIADLIESARTGKVTTKNSDDFRKWLYDTNDVKDAAAKGLGTALNGVQTVSDYIPGIGAVTRNPLFNAGQGALGGLADEFKMYGKDYDLGRAGQRAAVGAGGALASTGLADALKGSGNALLKSGTAQGLARGAVGGAIGAGGYTAIDGGSLGDVANSALQGAGMGAALGGTMGALQDFKPAKTYDVGLTDDERASRLKEVRKMRNAIGPEKALYDGTLDDASAARWSELWNLEQAYKNGFDNYEDYHNTLRPTKGIDDETLGQVLKNMKEPELQPWMQKGSHQPTFDPTMSSLASSMDRTVSGDSFMPDDFYQHMDWYGGGDTKPYLESASAIQKIRGNPNAKVTMYRATVGDTIYPNDWVTLSPEYAKQHLANALRDQPDAKIIKQTVAARDLRWPGDDINEFGYYPITNGDIAKAKAANGAPKTIETTLADADMAVNNPKLTPEQEAYFKDSVVRDENGGLKTLYHGSPNGKFTVFDSQYGNPENDWGKGFYFTDNEADVNKNYTGGGPDFDNKVARRAEQLADELNIDYDEAEQQARNEMFKGAYTIDAYANMKDPATVGKTTLFDGTEYGVKPLSDYDNIDDYYTDLIYELTDDVINDTNIDYNYKNDIMAILDEARWNGGIGLQELKDALSNLYIEDYDGRLVSGDVARSIIQNLGYDGIVDPTVSSKFKNMGIDDGTTHYITFEPNQIKSTGNLKPTANPDIMLSKKAPGRNLENALASGDAEINRVGSANVAPVDTATLPESMRAAKGFIDKDYIKDIEKHAGKKYADMNDSELLDYALSKRKPEDRDIMRVAYEDMIRGGSSARKIAESAAKNDYLSAIGETEYGDASGDGLMEYLLNHGNQIGNNSRTRAADIELSDRLGIAPGNTFMRDNANPYDSYGSYSPYDTTISIGDKAVGENAIGTIGHERLHSFQTEALMNRYDKEVLDAYRDLSKDLDKYIKNDAEIAKLHADDPADLAYWGNKDEQQARMLQQYLENKNFTKTGSIRNRAKEWGNEINPAFDKFFDKLRDLSKRGVALPALTALFGGGALMANQQKDKEEVK